MGQLINESRIWQAGGRVEPARQKLNVADRRPINRVASRSRNSYNHKFTAWGGPSKFNHQSRMALRQAMFE
jgi:hypothetical protein